jgi:hypothetical protein
MRRLFLETLINDLPVFDYTLEIARLAGRIDGGDDEGQYHSFY